MCQFSLYIQHFVDHSLVLSTIHMTLQATAEEANELSERFVKEPVHLHSMAGIHALHECRHHVVLSKGADSRQGLFRNLDCIEMKRPDATSYHSVDSAVG